MKTKRGHPAPAKELYISPWFRMARRYAETKASRWYILSAEHGLLDPHSIITPYETSLNTASREQRETWARGVARQMAALDLRGDEAVILAGMNYREYLLDDLSLRFHRLRTPWRD